jgi:hypothetical protein
MSLYDLPNWLLGVVVTGAVVAATLLAYFLFRRTYRGEFTEENKGLAVGILAIIATVTSLLLAFSAVSVWEAFASAEEAVGEEADVIGELARDLAVYGSGESEQARAMLRDYLQLVVSREWADMREGRENEEAWRAFDALFRVIGTLEPDTPRRTALLPEVWARTNELMRHRRDRLYTSQSQVPATLWIVVVLGVVITLGTTFVLSPTRFNVAMIGVLAFAFGLVFFFIIAMDRPFAGRESISPTPFEAAIQNMERWDVEVAK